MKEEAWPECEGLGGAISDRKSPALFVLMVSGSADVVQNEEVCSNSFVLFFHHLR